MEVMAVSDSDGKQPETNKSSASESLNDFSSETRESMVMSPPIDEESGNEGSGLTDGSSARDFSSRDATVTDKRGRNYSPPTESFSNGDTANESSSESNDLAAVLPGILAVPPLRRNSKGSHRSKRTYL